MEVDSVVNFRQKRNTHQNEAITFANPEDLQRYVQGLVEAKWKEKEAKSLKQNSAKSTNKSKTNQPDLMVLNEREKIKSPSDTTLYVPALQKTPE